MQNSKTTLIKSIFVMLLWGSLFPFIKLSYSAFKIDTAITGSILLFAGIRFTLCGLIVIGISKIQKSDMRITSNKNFFYLIMAALFAVILHYAFTYIGLTMVESSKTALLKQLGVLFFICFSFVFFKDDKFSLNKMISALLGIMGIIILNTNALHFSMGIGEILIILASFCTVFSNVFGKKLTQTMNPVVMTGYSQFIGGVVLIAVGIIGGGKITHISAYSILIFAYICTASILAYCMWNTLIKSNNLSELFIIKFAEPIFASIFSAAILNEHIFNLKYMFAILLTISSIVVLYYKKKGHRKIVIEKTVK